MRSVRNRKRKTRIVRRKYNRKSIKRKTNNATRKMRGGMKIERCMLLFAGVVCSLISGVGNGGYTTEHGTAITRTADLDASITDGVHRDYSLGSGAVANTTLFEEYPTTDISAFTNYTALEEIPIGALLPTEPMTVGTLESSPTNKTVVFIADTHGATGLRETLANANITVSKDDCTVHPNATFDQLIDVGDYLDRGKDDFENLQCMMKLQETAGENRVILLIGNHELMVVQGDFRYVNNLYKQNAGRLKDIQKTLVDGIKSGKLKATHYEDGVFSSHAGLSHEFTEKMFEKLGSEVAGKSDMQKTAILSKRVNDEVQGRFTDIANGKQTRLDGPVFNAEYGPFWYRDSEDDTTYGKPIPGVPSDTVQMVGHTVQRSAHPEINGNIVLNDHGRWAKNEVGFSYLKMVPKGAIRVDKAPTNVDSSNIGQLDAYTERFEPNGFPYMPHSLEFKLFPNGNEVIISTLDLRL